jgi:hypothetical protein
VLGMVSSGDLNYWLVRQRTGTEATPPPADG